MEEQMDREELSDDPAINNLLSKVVHDVRNFTQELNSRIRELVNIGGALTAEKNLNKLLEMIVDYARHYANADGCTLYILNEETDSLDFEIVQNGTLNVRTDDANDRVAWPSVPLHKPDGTPNHRNVSAYCALEGKIINIEDVYDARGFDFKGTKDFDATTGYRSKSMLLIPMRNHEDEVIGVLQLLNAQNPQTGKVIGFPEHEISMVASLASLAGIAITNAQLIQGLENLLHSFIKAIAAAIDEKSPYTGGHINRVADLTDLIARQVSDVRTGPLAGITFTADDLAEIRLAAWMHDIGKITTPEQIVDKSTKLEAIQDRIEIVAYRVELMKKDLEINYLKEKLASAGGASGNPQEESLELKALQRNLDEQCDFLRRINLAGEVVSDEVVDRIKEIGRQELTFCDDCIPLLSEEEITNLSIRKGTLSEQERDVINNHVTMSIKMLNNLPFPKKLRHVPLYAGMHHEKLNGTGYPSRLQGDAIPVPARILAIADVFEALTAADRPYKKGKLLSESMRILERMVGEGHLDGDICDLFVESGLVIDFARGVLSDRQMDSFQWKGKTYEVEPLHVPERERAAHRA